MSSAILFVLGAAVAAAVVALAAARIRTRRLLRRISALDAQLDAARVEGEAVARLASAGRVAAGLAHELGNPLCAITNYAHSLEPRVAPDFLPTLQSLQREVARIQRMMDGLIDYARPHETGAVGAHGADVNDALRETLRFLGDQGVLRRIAIDERLDGAALPVNGTALELEQTFANLLLNAADAMPAGGKLALWSGRLLRTTLVDGSLRRPDDPPAELPVRRDDRLERWLASHEIAQVVKVVIADGGHGVTRGHEERIFEPFVTTKAPAHGTGLGLAIVRGIVNRMGGIVWVQRSREGGAAFHLVVPVYAGDSAASH
jgi:two-component system NtrC family sensor kinase